MNNTITNGSAAAFKQVISSKERTMNLHELKIWIDGFQTALKDGQPTKEQWNLVVAQIMKSDDASTKGNK